MNPKPIASSRRRSRREKENARKQWIAFTVILVIGVSVIIGIVLSGM